LGSESIGINSATLENHLNYIGSCSRFLITFQVMAFSEVSTDHQNAIRTFGQGMDHKIRTDHSRAHHPDDPQIGWVLQTTDPSQVSSSVRSPRTQESKNDRFERIRHEKLLSANIDIGNEIATEAHPR